MYPRPSLGQAIDCLDPSNVDLIDCGGTIPPSDGNAIDWNNLIPTILTDLTQAVRPGTPSPTRLYTPAPPTATSIFSNPLALLAIGAGAWLVAKKL